MWHVSELRVARNKGATLIELAITMFIIGAAGLAASVLLVLTYNDFIKGSTVIDTQTGVASATRIIRSLFSRAININSTTQAIPTGTTIAATEPGYVRQITFNTLASAGGAGGAAALAVFTIENGGRPNNPNSSLFTGAGSAASIIWKAPTSTTSGVLFINIGATGVGNLPAPSFSNIYIDRLVAVSSYSHAYGPSDCATAGHLCNRNLGGAAPTANNYPLASFKLDLTFRIFDSVNASAFNWCPQADITAATAGCTTVTEKYRDTTTTITITLNNNIIVSKALNPGAPGITPLRPLGNLYMFPISYSQLRVQ